MKTAEEILKQNGLQIGFKSTYDWESIVKSIHDYTEQYKPKWIDASDRVPLCFEKGEWDGERSREVAFIDAEGNLLIGRMYSGYINGEYFEDWYHGKKEYCLDIPVLYWTSLPEKPEL